MLCALARSTVPPNLFESGEVFQGKDTLDRMSFVLCCEWHKKFPPGGISGATSPRSPCCHIIKVRMGSRGVYNPYLVLTPHTTTDILRCHTSDRLCLQVTSPTARRRVCPPVFSWSPVAMDLGSSLSFLHHPQSTEPAGSGSLSRRFLEPQSAGWSWPF